MQKNKLLILVILICGIGLGWGLAFTLRDSPTLRALWIMGLEIVLLMLWRLRTGI